MSLLDVGTSNATRHPDGITLAFITRKACPQEDHIHLLKAGNDRLLLTFLDCENLRAWEYEIGNLSQIPEPARNELNEAVPVGRIPGMHPIYEWPGLAALRGSVVLQAPFNKARHSSLPPLYVALLLAWGSETCFHPQDMAEQLATAALSSALQIGF